MACFYKYKGMTFNSKEELKDHLKNVELSTLDIDMNDFKLQFNPVHKGFQKVKNFSQFLYFLNVTPDMEEQADAVYGAISKIMQLQYDNIFKKLSTTSGIRSFIANGIKGEEFADLREAVLGDVDLNMPLIMNRALTYFISQFHKNVFDISFSGSKAVLVSSMGMKNRDGGRLRYVKNSKGGVSAQVILPLSYKDTISIGEELFIGVRIPSTGVHSAILCVCEGFFDSKDTNAVVVPAETLWLHGADLDVDSLYIIKQDRGLSFENKSFDLSDYVVDVDNYTLINFAEKNRISINNARRIRKLISRFISDYELLRNSPDKDVPSEVSKFLHNYFDFIGETRFKGSSAKQNEISTQKNIIIKNYIEAIQSESSIDFMMSNINMGMFNSDSDDSIKSKFKRLAEAKDQGHMLSKTFDLSSPKGRLEAFITVFNGTGLVGVFANFAKAVAYIYKLDKSGFDIEIIDATLMDEHATRIVEQFKGNIYNANLFNNLAVLKTLERIKAIKITKKENTLTLKNPIKFLDKEYTRISPEFAIWEIMDAVINSAIDNVKEQILPMLNVNGDTATAYAMGVVLGIDLLELSKLFRQSALIGTDFKKFLRNQRDDDLPDSDIASITLDDLDNNIDFNDLNTTTASSKHDTSVRALFHKLKMLGERVSAVSKAIDPIRETPTNWADLATIDRKWKYVFENDKFMFNISLVNLPEHIVTMRKYFIDMMDYIKRTFVIHNDRFQSAISSITNVKVSSVENELSKYIQSMLGNFDNEPEYQVRYKKGNDVVIKKLIGVEAFAQRYANDVLKAMKSLYLEAEHRTYNAFLDHLAFETDRWGKTIVTFNYTDRLTIEDIERLRVDISNAFREYSNGESLLLDVYNLMKFVSVTNGFTSAQNHFAKLFSPPMLRIFSSGLTQLYRDINSLDDHLFNNFIRNFNINLGTMYPSSLPYISSKVATLLSEKVNDKVVYKKYGEYDIAYSLVNPSEENIFREKYEIIKQGKFDSPFVLIHIVDSVAMYRRIDKAFAFNPPPIDAINPQLADSSKKIFNVSKFTVRGNNVFVEESPYFQLPNGSFYITTRADGTDAILIYKQGNSITTNSAPRNNVVSDNLSKAIIEELSKVDENINPNLSLEELLEIYKDLCDAMSK